MGLCLSVAAMVIGSGEYASQMLKVGEAAKPKGCFTDFVPILLNCVVRCNCLVLREMVGFPRMARKARETS